jgi:hypothetical protein
MLQCQIIFLEQNPSNVLYPSLNYFPFPQTILFVIFPNKNGKIYFYVLFKRNFSLKHLTHKNRFNFPK